MDGTEDSVSRDQFSQDQLPPDQLSRDQLATRSSLTRSTCHEINSSFLMFYWTRASWGKHQKVFGLELTSIRQISIAVTMFCINKFLPFGLGGWKSSSQCF